MTQCLLLLKAVTEEQVKQLKEVQDGGERLNVGTYDETNEYVPVIGVK